MQPSVRSKSRTSEDVNVIEYLPLKTNQPCIITAQNSQNLWDIADLSPQIPLIIRF